MWDQSESNESNESNAFLIGIREAFVRLRAHWTQRSPQWLWGTSVNASEIRQKTCECGGMPFAVLIIDVWSGGRAIGHNRSDNNRKQNNNSLIWFDLFGDSIARNASKDVMRLCFVWMRQMLAAMGRQHIATADVLGWGLWSDDWPSILHYRIHYYLLSNNKRSDHWIVHSVPKLFLSVTPKPCFHSILRAVLLLLRLTRCASKASNWMRCVCIALYCVAFGCDAIRVISISFIHHIQTSVNPMPECNYTYAISHMSVSLVEKMIKWEKWTFIANKRGEPLCKASQASERSRAVPSLPLGWHRHKWRALLSPLVY